MEKGVGSHDIKDFKKATVAQLNTLFYDVASLDKLGLNIDAKPRNLLYDEKIGFQLIDLFPKTRFKDTQEALSHTPSDVNQLIRKTLGLLGGSFSQEEIVSAAKLGDLRGAQAEYKPKKRPKFKLPHNQPFNWFDPHTREFKEVSATSPKNIPCRCILPLSSPSSVTHQCLNDFFVFFLHLSRNFLSAVVAILFSFPFVFSISNSSLIFSKFSLSIVNVTK